MTPEAHMPQIPVGAGVIAGSDTVLESVASNVHGPYFVERDWMPHNARDPTTIGGAVCVESCWQ